MREKRNFAERTKALDSPEIRKKYFLVYEGENTEVIYFDAVNELRNEVKIKIAYCGICDNDPQIINGGYPILQPPMTMGRVIQKKL